MRISIPLVLLLLLTLHFANVNALDMGYPAMTEITLEESYDSNEEFLEDFRLKAIFSGKLFYSGLNAFFGVIKGTVERAESVIEGFKGVVSGIVSWIEEFLSSLRLPPWVVPPWL